MLEAGEDSWTQILQEQAAFHVVQALTWESSVVHLQLKMAAARAPPCFEGSLSPYFLLSQGSKAQPRQQAKETNLTKCVQKLAVRRACLSFYLNSHAQFASLCSQPTTRLLGSICGPWHYRLTLRLVGASKDSVSPLSTGAGSRARSFLAASSAATVVSSLLASV